MEVVRNKNAANRRAFFLFQANKDTCQPTGEGQHSAVNATFAKLLPIQAVVIRSYRPIPVFGLPAFRFRLMKKLLLCCLLGLLLLPEAGHAQRRRQSRTSPLSMGLTFGLKGGLNYANFAGEGTKEAGRLGAELTYSGQPGLLIGGLVNYRIAPQLSFQAEVLYTARGTNRAGSAQVSPTVRFEQDEKIRLSYVDVPLLVKYNASFLYLEGGLVPGFLLSGTAATSGITSVTGGTTTTSGSSTEFKDFQTEFNSVELGLGFGAGIEVPAGLIIGLRYVRGFQNVGSKESPALLLTNKGLNNQSIQATAGYIFNHSSRRGRR